MELFSKRNNILKSNSIKAYNDAGNADDAGLLSSELKMRLSTLIEDITSGFEYVERFFLVDNKKVDRIHISRNAMAAVSKRELGYDISEMLGRHGEILSDSEQYRDSRLFDLLELLIIFSKLETRKFVVSRLQDIFIEEQASFIVHNFMIFPKGGKGLENILPLIKDKQLKDKIDQFFRLNYSMRSKLEALARVSADIIQRVFSSPDGQNQTKSYTEELLHQLAKKWTDQKNAQELYELLNQDLKLLKALNNKISDIRHTDQSSIPVDSPDLYRLIAIKNMAMVELLILSLPELYILNQNPEELKEKYLFTNQIDKETQWVINPDEIRVEDIPF